MHCVLRRHVHETKCVVCLLARSSTAHGRHLAPLTTRDVTLEVRGASRSALRRRVHHGEARLLAVLGHRHRTAVARRGSARSQCVGPPSRCGGRVRNAACARVCVWTVLVPRRIGRTGPSRCPSAWCAIYSPFTRMHELGARAAVRLRWLNFGVFSLSRARPSSSSTGRSASSTSRTTATSTSWHFPADQLCRDRRRAACGGQPGGVARCPFAPQSRRRLASPSPSAGRWEAVPRRRRRRAEATSTR